jgi:hypothetical protein
MNNTQNKKTIYFNDALEEAKEVIISHFKIKNGTVTIVRDLYGKIRILLKDTPPDFQIETFCKELSDSLGPYGYPPESLLLYEKDIPFVLDSLDTVFLEKTKNGTSIYLLDRQINAQDWLKPPFTRTLDTPRVTFFGIKDGVGRSTAMILWAWMLAKEGKNVLLFDLDLESPGISKLLLPKDFLPDYGLIDWFVEDMVGQGDLIFKRIVAPSPVGKNLQGEILVAPAFGQKTDPYIPKLSRCFNHKPGNPPLSWGERLHSLIIKLENEYKPDISLLDSRSGIHDIAAVTIIRMNAFSFLFAIDSSQTWQAYQFLLSYLQNNSNIQNIRQNLQVISSLIPETGRDDYLNRFITNAWDVFRETLYDEVEESELGDFFSFDRNDEEAPHWPLPIYWHRALQEFNPCNDMGYPTFDEKTIEEALGLFHERAKKIVFGYNK